MFGYPESFFAGATLRGCLSSGATLGPPLHEGFPTCLPDRQARFACGNDYFKVLIARVIKAFVILE
jgi:hypothetical protein